VVNPDKEKFRKMLSEFDQERTEKLKAQLKIDPTQNQEQYQKATKDYLLWSNLKIAELLRELRQWAMSD
jgi:hypothetical protein